MLNGDVLQVVTDGTTADVDCDVAMRPCVCLDVTCCLAICFITLLCSGNFFLSKINICSIIRLQLTVTGIGHSRKSRADRRQTASAIDGAQHGAVADVYLHVATHGTGRQGLARESTTTAEDVSIDIRRSRSADVRISGRHGLFACSHGHVLTGLDGHACVGQHVTVLTAAEDRAVDAGLVAHLHDRIVHVGPGVEVDALVALTGTEEVTRHGVSGNLLQRAGHAQRTATHLHGAFTIHILNGGSTIQIILEFTHVGHLVAAVDIA